MKVFTWGELEEEGQTLKGRDVKEHMDPNT